MARGRRDSLRNKLTRLRLIAKTTIDKNTLNKLSKEIKQTEIDLDKARQTVRNLTVKKSLHMRNNTRYIGVVFDHKGNPYFCEPRSTFELAMKARVVLSKELNKQLENYDDKTKS